MPNNIRGNIDTLAGAYSIYGDGNLGRLQSSANPPRIAIFGSAASGKDYTPLVFTEDTIDGMRAVFGEFGDMMQQVQEMQTKGANACLAMRIGARPFFAMHIGATVASPSGQEDGYWIEHVYGGTDTGTRFGLAYDKVSGRLVIADNANNKLVVFDNNSTAPVDLGLFLVRGTPSPTAGADGSAIGSVSTPTYINLASLVPVDGRIVSYAGDNGTSISRMRLFEGVMKGFAALEGFRYNYLPMPPRATLDAPFKADYAALSPVGTAYPAQNATNDTLGKVYIEFVEDKLEFYWDVDGDNAAEYWSVADTSSYATTSKGGTSFSSDSFLTPNFAYALAYHCYRTTYEQQFIQGMVAVEPPPIGRPLSQWIGRKPTLSTAFDGSVTVTANGTGLLGNKYLAGNTAYRSAKAYGGFIATTEPFFDSGTELKDVNNQPVDMGKFLSIWITPEIFQPVLIRNNQTYVAISPVSYASFRDGLTLNQSPTNKPYVARQGVLTSRLTRSQRADLSQMRYTYAVEDFAGVRIEDGPSASLPSSDYTRQGTIEIVQFVDGVLRQIANPFIGRHLSAEEEVALQKELEEGMNALIGNKTIRNGVAKLIITPQDRILGQGNVAVSIEAPFELQRIFFTVNLRKGA